MKLLRPLLAAIISACALTSSHATTPSFLMISNFSDEEVELVGVVDRPAIPSRGALFTRAPLDRPLRIRSIRQPERFCDFSTQRQHTWVNVEPPELPAGWMRHAVLGFDVFLSPAIARNEAQLAADLQLLEGELAKALALLPTTTHARLREAQFWLDRQPYESGFPFTTLSPARGFGDVRIANLANYDRWTVILQALARVYHFRVLGLWNEEIRQAFDNAEPKGLYPNLEKNLPAYFAKRTQAYFGVGTDYPFTRAELEKHDPVGYRVVAKAWAGALDTIAPSEPITCRLEQRSGEATDASEPDAFGPTFVDKDTCDHSLPSVWVMAGGRGYCMRYVIATPPALNVEWRRSSAGGLGTRELAVVLNGDVAGDDLRPGAARQLQNYADALAKRTGLTAVVLARMGLDGSSGRHSQRKTPLEIDVTGKALDAIKEEHSLEKLHMIGQSGGSLVIVGLMSRRRDFGCVVIGAGPRLLGASDRAANERRTPESRLFDPEDVMDEIAANGAERIFVVSDPRDARIPFESQERFVAALRQRDRSVEHMRVVAIDPEHHGVLGHSSYIGIQCMNGVDPAAIMKKYGR